MIRSQTWMIVATITMAFGTASCGTDEQGYWTKQNLSQALTNEQYPSDSRHCEAMVANDGIGRSEDYKSALYTKCMQAQGYQWVTERPDSHLLQSSHKTPTQIPLCPTGRLIVDAFGYHKCVPTGGKDRGITIEIPPRPLESAAKPSQENQPSVPSVPANNEWNHDHEMCRQYAKDSLSSPYGVYSRCMQDKGWLSGS